MLPSNLSLQISFLLYSCPAFQIYQLLHEKLSFRFLSIFSYSSNRLFLIFLPLQIIDKLLRSSSGNSAMAQLPFICLCFQLILRHLDACFCCQMDHNVKVLFLARFGVIDRNTKTINQRKLLLHCIGTSIPSSCCTSLRSLHVSRIR